MSLILVTGGSGRIGSHLAQTLRQGGHQVRAFDRVAPPTDSVDDFVVGDLDDAQALAAALDGVTAVAHLAALMSWHPKDEDAMFAINAQGTFNLLQVTRGRGIQRFVFASSGEVYPELKPVYLPIDENHATLPTSAYGMTKLLGEEMVKAHARRHGLSTCILRFAHTQAPEELFDPNSFFSGPRFYVNAKLRQLRGLPPSSAVEQSVAALEAVATPEEQHYIGCASDGTPYRMGICAVSDMIEGVRLGLEHPAASGETFNIGPQNAVAFDEFVPYLAQKTGLPVQPVSLHTASYRYETSVEKAQRELGYAPQMTIFDMIDEGAKLREGNLAAD